jgi:hypothetical protein
VRSFAVLWLGAFFMQSFLVVTHELRGWLTVGQACQLAGIPVARPPLPTAREREAYVLYGTFAGRQRRGMVTSRPQYDSLPCRAEILILLWVAKSLKVRPDNS